MLEIICLRILFQAYRLGLYGPKVVWIFVTWYSSEFWRHNLDIDNVPCTVEEMEQSVDGAFLLGFFFRNPVLERGIAGITGILFFLCIVLSRIKTNYY